MHLCCTTALVCGLSLYDKSVQLVALSVYKLDVPLLCVLLGFTIL